MEHLKSSTKSSKPSKKSEIITQLRKTVEKPVEKPVENCRKLQKNLIQSVATEHPEAATKLSKAIKQPNINTQQT